MENFHIIKVSYVGATNFKGSRVKIESERFKQSKFIPYNYEFNNVSDIALDHLKGLGFEFIGHGEATNGYYLISTTFEAIK